MDGIANIFWQVTTSENIAPARPAKMPLRWRRKHLRARVELKLHAGRRNPLSN